MPPDVARLTRRRAPALFAMMVLMALSPPLLRAQTPAPTSGVRALRTTAAIRLDGVPDEPVWLEADSITEFTQRDPAEGAPATERTVVRFLARPGGLYVGVWAMARAPDRIRRAQLRRDADLESDDVFGLVLDPQRDRRTGYAFSINPNGAMWDAEVLNPENTNDDWNGVWDARARVGPTGWTAELLVPWQTLRYPAAGEAWGLNVGRVIRHKNEEVLWRAWRRQQGFLYLEDEGELTGLGELPRRGLVEARPYAATTGALALRTFDSSGA